MKNSLKLNKTRSKSAGFIHINFRTQHPKTVRGFTSRQNNETDLFTGMYNGKNISQQNESKLIIYKGVSMGIDQIVKLKTKTQPRTTKTVEQLLEQNIQLKNEANKLKEQISIMKAQMSVNYKRKSDHDLGKQMEIQFYKDVYWSNNEKSFRIVGMRQQYQKLKKQYSKQTKQLQQAKAKLIKNGIAQAQVYIEELQLQNKKYMSIIVQHNERVSKSKSHTPLKSNREKREQEMKNKNLQQELLTLKQKLKQKDRQITFLEKVIIGKDNRENSINKRTRKVQKQNDILADSHNNLLDELELMKRRQEIQNIKYKSFYTEQINQLKRQFRKQLAEKDKAIKELQLNCKKIQSGNKNNALSQSAGISFSLLNSKTNRKLSLDYGSKDLMRLQQEHSGIPSKRYVSDHKQQVEHKLQSNNSQIQPKAQAREPKRADKKHSDKSQKVRKVQFSQVQHLGELLRYRMIGFRIGSNQIKDEFIRKKVFTQQSNRSKSQNQISVIAKQLTNSELEWQDQYISMKQIIDIVTKQPFNLDTKQSVLLARYLIEDSDSQYVYCDQINQNNRQIVKSIIKSLIGPYQLTSQADIAAYTEVMSRFSANLRTTLSTYYPEGVLPKQKLIEVVKGIGVELNAKQRQLLIGKASIKSLNLNQLKYMAIFE